MTREKFEFTDSRRTNTEVDLTMVGAWGKKDGCYVSTVGGVAFIFLVVLIAICVGTIMHFVGESRNPVCECDRPTTSSAVSSVLQSVEMASDRGTEICTNCPVLDSTCEHATPARSTATHKVTDVRLPTSLYPEHYNVRLQPNMYGRHRSQFTFKGSVKIILMCNVPTSKIYLHTKVLTVNSSSIRFQGFTTSADDPEYTGWKYDTDRQFFIVQLSNDMRVGSRYILEMLFTSPLKDGPKGLHYNTYKRGNKSIYLATTQLYVTNARKTFPCFDEPALKSTFNITLVRPDYLISISNMPILSSDETFQDDGITYVADVFQQTPSMSTYLLAFIVCDFEFKMDRTKNGVDFRAWAVKESLDEVDYSLDFGMKVLTYFEEYFEMFFPLPKQDMIAIPDFSTDAMENWGLITYSERSMLYRPGMSYDARKERVAVVISHQLAHHWFGNLVTLSWWDDLWLNEGFANFMQYIGIDHVHPDWNMFDKFVVDHVQTSFNFDCLVSSHPVYVPVSHPDETDEIFDNASYQKASSIIRMMRHFLGEETFRKALVRYLSEKAYGSATHDDLWEAFTRQIDADGKIHIDVKAVMDTWTLQMNYPIVTVTRDYNDDSLIHFRQDRYLQDPEAEDHGKYESPFDYRWTIPLTFTSSRRPDFSQDYNHIYWMDKTKSTMTINLRAANMPDTKSSWILANVLQYGYYRVNYQKGNWRSLSNQLITDHKVSHC